MNRSTSARLAAALALVYMGAASAAPADEQRALNELRNTVVNLLQGLVEQGVIPREKAEQMVRDAQTKAAADAAATAARDKAEEGAIRVPYVPQIVKDEIRKQVAADLSAEVTKNVTEEAKTQGWGVPAAMPDWVRRTTWSGDLRLRAQADMFASDNATNTYVNFQAVNQAGGIGKAGLAALSNTTIDRQRLRARLRIGLESNLGDGWTVVARMATGDLRDPSTENQTFGNTMNRYQLGVDQAYVEWTGATKSGRQALTVTGGRMQNPWLYTNLVWNDDLRFDGVAATYRLGLTRENPSTHGAFLTLAALPVQEVELANGKWLYGAQLGEDWTFSGGSRWRVGAAYYLFKNVTGRRNAFGSNLLDYTAPQFLQRGNTLFDIRNDADPTTNLFALAAQYKLVDVTTKYDWKVLPGYRLSLTGDYVKNVGYKQSDVFAATGLVLAARTTGYQAEIGFGSAEMTAPTNWRAFFGYRYLERDAVLDALTDPDFHLGSTDTKGYFVGAEYTVSHGVRARARFLSASEIDGPPLSINVLQLDLNASF